MISKKMAERLHEHLEIEFQAWYAYFAMATYCRLVSLRGFAAWFDRQAEEEKGHAMKVYHYMLEQDLEVELPAIKKPAMKFKDISDCFETALAQEKAVTKLVNEITGEAVAEKDFATQTFEQWFVTEQVEEESSIRDILEDLSFVKDSKEGLFLLDREMGSTGGKGEE